jgi:prevent-host-death family protein
VEQRQDDAVDGPELQNQTMKMTISELKRQLSPVINAVHRKETRVLIEKSGVPVAALVSVEDLERLTTWDRERDEHFAVIDRMRAAFRDVPPEEIEREAERSLTAARKRRRQQIHEAAARSA